MKTKIKFSKQILSVFLCLAMLFAYVPMTVFAVENDITVYVKSPSGQSAEFLLPSSTTIETVKEKIANEFSVSFEDTYRIYCSEVGYPNYKLEDEAKSLADYNFQSGYTIYVEKDIWTATSDQPIEIFGLTIIGGTGAQEPYGSYSSADYYWNYYYKTITIKTDTPITISGTADEGANIIIKSRGWHYLTLDNVTMNESGGACISLNPSSWLDLTLVGTNQLTTTPKTEYGVEYTAPAISLNNTNTYLWINEASTGSLTATTTCDDMPGIGTCLATDQVYGIVMKGGNITANGGNNAPGVRCNYLAVSGGTLTANSGESASTGILVYDTNEMTTWSQYEGLLSTSGSGVVVSNNAISAAYLINKATLTFTTYEALSATTDYDHTNSTGKVYVGTDEYIWDEIQSKWIRNPKLPVTVGDFTIVATDGETTLTADTDYTYEKGVLTVKTVTPVTIGMREGVTTTAETIVVDSTNGETTVTFDGIGIDTEKDEAIAAKGGNSITFRFNGENSVSAATAGDGINVVSNTPIIFTSASNGKLSISGVKFGIFLEGYSTGGNVAVGGNLQLDITDCSAHAIYCRNTGTVTISETPVINIDTGEWAIYGHGIDISGGTITVKNDEGYPITSAESTYIKLSNTADLHILDGRGGLRVNKGKITITDSAKYKVYSMENGNKVAVADKFPLISTGSSGEVEISKNAVVELYSANDAISGGKTSIIDNAQVDIVIDTDSTYSEYALSFDDTLTIADNATVDIDVKKGTKVRGVYDSSGTVNISDNAVLTIDGTTYTGIYVDALNLSEQALVTVNADDYYALYGDISVKDTAVLTATSVDDRVLYDPCTVTPAEGKVYMVKYGASEITATTAYYTTTGTISDKSTWRYFHVEAIDFVPVTQASVAIDAPVKNGIPDTTAEIASNSDYTVSAVTWDGNPTKFLGGTEYTATFTLTAKDGFAFDSDTEVTVADAVVTKVMNDDGTLTVNAKFSATEAAIAVSIAVATQPNDTEYTYGEKFDPSGLVITVTNDDGTTKDIIYGDTNQTDFSFSPTELTVATTKITVTYEGKSADIDVKVNKATLTVTVEDKTAIYGDVIPNYTVSYDGFMNGDTKNDLNGELSFDCRYAQFSDKGEYTIKASGYTSDNYEFEYVDGKLTVNAKPITVTIQNATSIYGNDIAELKATDNGIVNGDTNVYSLATTATSTSNVGKYAIKGTALDSNYEITFANEADAYEITKREITITVDAKNAIVNTGLPSYTYRVEGLFGEDKFVTEPTLSCNADITVIGEYDIIASDADAGSNYSIKYVSAKLTVLNDNAVDAAAGYTEELKDYNPATVTSEDKAKLDEILDEINTILDNKNITDNGKKALEEVKEQVENLIKKITDAAEATDTENTEQVKDVTAENVTPEDKTDLEKAKADLEKALEDYGGNYTDGEKKAIEDELERIDDALDVIENVEAVEELIDKIPENITKNDEAAIKAADDALNALTDYEKSLVDEDMKKALDDAKAALAELNNSAVPNSPQTGDNSNPWLWFALLFISGGGLFTLTVVDKKRKAVK